MRHPPAPASSAALKLLAELVAALDNPFARVREQFVELLPRARALIAEQQG